MALAIDGSSPAIATQTNGTIATVTTASFNPPAGSVLLVLWSGDALTTPSAPTITDNLGVHLTYNLTDWKSVADAPTRFGQAAAWTAVVGAGGSMTVTVTSGSVSGERTAALCVQVMTGADTTTPAGAHGKSGSASAASIAQSYTAQSTGGWGFIAVCDFDAVGAETAGTGCTLIGSALVGSNFDYGYVRRTTADDSNGGSNTLNVTLPGTSTNLAWVYVEVNPATTATSIPYNPQRTTPVRDPGEVYWIQKDRRNANLVATAANDLAPPLLVPEHQWQQYRVSDFISRRLVPQQPNRVGDMSLFATPANDLAVPLLQPVDPRYDVTTRLRSTWPQQRELETDPSLLSPTVAMDPPAAQRYIPPRDYGEVQWHQTSGRDPSLLTTALLENELLGGAETDKRTNVPATHAARWWMPRQPKRDGFTPGLLDDALLEPPLVWIRPPQYIVDRRLVPQQRAYFDPSLLLTALLESPLAWVRPPQYVVDRREVPQQRAYISDPSFYPVAGATDPLTLAWGAGGNYWHLYNDVRVERRVVPQQRQLESDPSLLDTALLESPLLVGSFRQIIVDRRVQPRQPRWPDLMVQPADPLVVGGGVGGDQWRRYNTPATHVDRRQTVRERPRWTVYTTVDLGLGPNPPFVSSTPSGTYVSESGTGSSQQTVNVAIVSQDGFVIVSQTVGGVL